MILRNWVAYISVALLVLLLAVRWAATVAGAAPPDPVALKVQGADSLGTPLQVIMAGSGAAGSQQTAVSSSANAANASNAATLSAAVGKTTYITGLVLSGSGSTAGLAVNATVTGTAGGTLNFTFTFPTGVLVPAQPVFVEFTPPLAASATNTAIVVTLPAGGAGNTNAAVSAWGYQQ